MFYLDRIHTSAFGAKVNAESAAEGIREYAGLELANYLKPIEQDTITGSSRKEGCPVVFTIGDSTVKNKDDDKKNENPENPDENGGSVTPPDGGGNEGGGNEGGGNEGGGGDEEAPDPTV